MLHFVKKLSKARRCLILALWFYLKQLSMNPSQNDEIMYLQRYSEKNRIKKMNGKIRLETRFSVMSSVHIT
ncbi:hypothetical protein AAHE18_19G027100 [Arachis hypogaea]